MVEIKHHTETINRIGYHYAEAGEGSLVILLHGFPELWYSWRHQLPELAKHGFRAVAPDLRGMGTSEVTHRVEDYSLLNHAEDVRALIAALGDKPVVLAGHDWGANLMWAMALKYPEVIRAVIALSIPFYPAPRDPEQIRQFSQGHFDFMAYFQRPGAVEREFAEDPEEFFRRFLYGLSGDAPDGTTEALYVNKPASAGLLEGFPRPERLPPWLTEANIRYFADSYTVTGMSGALGFYRNYERDYSALKDLYRRQLKQPALFIGGEKEAAVRFGKLDPMRQALPGLTETLILPGCGHWVQQERPERVTSAMLAFLNRLLQPSEQEVER